MRRRFFAPPAALLALAGALTLGSFSGSAAAQSKEELDKARVLFAEGVSLAAANNCAAALAKYRAVAKVKSTAQISFNIAECEERLGKLVSALGSYRLAASQVTDGKPAEVASRVGDRIQSLEARLPSLQIQRTEQTSRLELDGVEIGGSQVGIDIPVDPGSHVVSGKIGETEVWRETVEVAEKEKKTVIVKIDIEKFKPPSKPTATATGTAPPPPTVTAEPPSRTPAYVVGGLGIAALGAGVGLFVASRGAVSDLEKLCGGDSTCPKSAEATANSGRLLTGLGEALFVAGAVGIGAGVVLFIRASGSAPAPAKEGSGSASFSQVRVSASMTGRSSGGLQIAGRF